MSTVYPSSYPPSASSPARPDRLAAALLAGAALLTLVLVLHHPVLHGRRGAADVAAGVTAIAPATRLVHGGLLVLLAAQALGFSRFCARLGWGRLTVAGGFLAYAAGALLMTIPALLDGFVTPDLAAACLRAAQGCGAADGAAFRLVAVLIQDFTKAGLVAMAGATGAWALALVTGASGEGVGSREEIDRAAGIAGLLCAAAPVAVLFASDVYLRPGTLAGLLGAQVLWCLLAAAVMVRSRSGAPPPAGAAR